MSLLQAHQDLREEHEQLGCYSLSSELIIELLATTNVSKSRIQDSQHYSLVYEEVNFRLLCFLRGRIFSFTSGTLFISSHSCISLFVSNLEVTRATQECGDKPCLGISDAICSAGTK